MLKSGLDLNHALIVLSKQSRNKEDKNIYNKIRKNVESGLSFAKSLKKETKFSKTFVAVIAAGENTGTLVEVLKRLEKFLAKQKDLKKDIKKACFYPITVIITVILAAITILKLVFPVFVDLFNDFGGTLPLLTRIFINLANFINNYLFLLLIFVILLIISILYLLKNKKDILMKTSFIFKIPLISKLYRSYILTEIAVYLSLFLKSGLSILLALDFLENIINNSAYKKFINKTALNISKGASLSESFSNKKYIPDFFYYLLVTGEESAQLEFMLERVGDYYYKTLKDGIAKLLQYLEPLLITLTAIFVALLAAAVVMPMFQIYLII